MRLLPIFENNVFLYLVSAKENDSEINTPSRHAQSTAS